MMRRQQQQAGGRGDMTAQADLQFERELWEAAVRLRGTIAPADYKHYVLPLLFLRYLSLRYETRRQHLQRVTDPRSGIVSDPNNPADPEAIVRLVKQVVTVSLETVRIVGGLPGLA